MCTPPPTAATWPGAPACAFSGAAGAFQFLKTQRRSRRSLVQERRRGRKRPRGPAGRDEEGAPRPAPRAARSRSAAASCAKPRVARGDSRARRAPASPSSPGFGGGTGAGGHGAPRMHLYSVSLPRGQEHLSPGGGSKQGADSGRGQPTSGTSEAGGGVEVTGTETEPAEKAVLARGAGGPCRSARHLDAAGLSGGLAAAPRLQRPRRAGLDTPLAVTAGPGGHADLPEPVSAGPSQTLRGRSEEKHRGSARGGRARQASGHRGPHGASSQEAMWLPLQPPQTGPLS